MAYFESNLVGIYLLARGESSVLIVPERHSLAFCFDLGSTDMFRSFLRLASSGQQQL